MTTELDLLVKTRVISALDEVGYTVVNPGNYERLFLNKMNFIEYVAIDSLEIDDFSLNRFKTLLDKSLNVFYKNPPKEWSTLGVVITTYKRLVLGLTP